MLLAGCATGVSNFEDADQSSFDSGAGYALFRPHWNSNGDTKADLQIKLVRIFPDGTKQPISYSMPAGATQVVTLAPGYYALNYVMAGGNGVAPRSLISFVVKTGQVSYPGDWWFQQKSAGYVNVMAPRKQNFHQHDLFAMRSEVECDPDAEQSWRSKYPRLSQVLPLVYSGPDAPVGWKTGDDAPQGQGGAGKGTCRP